MPSRVAQWEFRRGRQDELEKTGTGTATVLIHDVDGDYDPSNISSPYWLQLDGAPIALSLRNPVTDTWHTRFQGVVDEYTYDLSASQRNMDVTLNCVDAFDYLATAEMAPPSGDEHGFPIPADAEVDGDAIFYETAEVDTRIRKLLNDAQWPSGQRVIFTGNVVVQEAVYDAGYSFLAAIQDAADSEWPGVANVFCDSTNRVCFHGRLARFDPEGTAATAGSGQWNFTRWKVGDGDAIAGDATYAQLRPPLHMDRSLKLVYNVAQIYPSHGDQLLRDYTDEEYQALVAANVSRNTGSIPQFGIRNFPATEIRTLEHKTNGNNAFEETMLMAQYYTDNFGGPHTRPRQITVKSVWPSDPRAPATWGFLTGVEISDVITLKVGFPGGGGLEEDFYVEGITTVCRPLQPESSWSGGFDYVEVTCDVSPAAYWPAGGEF